MKYIIPVLGAAVIAGALISCDDSTYIGNSIVQNDIEIVIDSSFTVSGKSVAIERVQSRTVTQLLGAINAEGFGSFKSDIVCQFMPAANLVTDGVTVDDIDSLKLVLLSSKDGFVGDSLVPMGLEVYPLTKQLPSPIYSDFDPTDYYDASSPLGSQIYSTTAIGVSDSLAALSYRGVYVDLPLSLGKKLFTAYKNNPSAFADPTQFSKIFPGIYIKNSYGSGRVMQVVVAEMRMYYRQTLPIEDTDNDSTYYQEGSYFAVTPEVINNNNISYRMADDLIARADAGEAIIAAPVGREVRMTFPTREIIASYRENAGNMAIINSLTFSIPAEEITNNYSIEPPTYLLMVKTSEKDKFFANSSLTDGETSFYATYDETTKSYTFDDMREYILDMLAADEITNEDVEFTLTPISIATESSSSSSYYSYYYSSSSTTTTYVSEMVPYVAAPAMVKLDLENAKIKFTYSKQTMKK